MRVLVDARIGWGSGIGRVVAETVPRVAARRPDWRFDLLIGRPDVERVAQATAGSANLCLCPTDIVPFTAREQVALPALAAGYDLTWFTNYWVPLRYRAPFVVTVHDMLHLRPDLFPAGRAKRALSRATFRKVRRDARAVMFDSRFTQRAFAADVGAPRDGVVVHLGADHLPAIPPDRLAGKEKRLLVVAAAKQHKNHPTVLEAWRRAAVGPDWTLTVVSPADPLRSSVDLAAAAGEKVELVRGLSDAALADLFARSAVLLAPSRYEGFGLPLLEAMRAGLWCISSTAGSLVEIGEGAFFTAVDADDGPGWTVAIERLCAAFDREPGLYRPLLEYNLDHAARFTWDRTADQVAAVLSAAAGHPSSDQGTS